MKKKEKSEIAAQLGRLGGKAVVKKHGKKHMRNIGKKGAEARWNKNPQ